MKWFQPNSFGEVCFLEKSFESAKNSNLENFESALYSTSGSMPLVYWDEIIINLCGL